MAAPVPIALHDDVEIARGDTIALRYTILDGDGNAWDGTGYSSITWALAKGTWKRFDTAVLTDASSGVTVDATGIASGIVTVTVSPTASSALSEVVHYGELRIVDASAQKSVTARGHVKIEPALAA